LTESGRYAVLLTSAARRDLRRLRGSTAQRIRESLAALASDPRARASKLAGRNSYRVRVGDYRIVFRVDDDTRRILIARIAHRRDVYRR
jgi:mRNA interferase RelE/StbE